MGSTHESPSTATPPPWRSQDNIRDLPHLRYFAIRKVADQTPKGHISGMFCLGILLGNPGLENERGCESEPCRQKRGQKAPRRAIDVPPTARYGVVQPFDIKQCPAEEPTEYVIQVTLK